MKANRILSGFIVAFAAMIGFSSCNKEAPLGDPDVTLSSTTINFSASEEEQVVELVSTLDWTLKETDAAWLAVNPKSGKASNDPQKITIEVTANTGKDRTATIVFYGDKVHTAALTINQSGSQKAGDGSLANPYSASEAKAVADALESGATTPEKVYVHGFVKKFASKHEDGVKSFGNALFYMTDDASLEGDDFYAYQVYYLGGKKFTSLDQIAVGDEVIVYGKLTNYNGTAETEGKGAAFIYSLNGKTEGGNTPEPGPAPETFESSAESPASASAALAYAKTLAEGTEVEAYVKGIISQIDEINTGQYGNATYWISDDGTSANQFEIFRGYYLNGDKFTAENQIKIGQEVVVFGKIINYKGNTPEMTQGSSLISITGEGVTPEKPEIPEGSVLIDLSDQGYENAQDVESLTIDGITIKFSKEGGSNGPKYYNTGSAVRCYPGNTVTVSADSQIASITFTSAEGDSSKGTTRLSLDGDSKDYTAESWSGESKEVVFEVNSSTGKGHRRISKILVTLK